MSAAVGAVEGGRSPIQGWNLGGVGRSGDRCAGVCLGARPEVDRNGRRTGRIVCREDDGDRWIRHGTRPCGGATFV